LIVEYESAEGGTKGLISTTIGDTPFYTNESNPRSITLNKDESQIITFWVNATGDIGDSYEFFAYANVTSDMSISNYTSSWNVSITAPQNIFIQHKNVELGTPNNINYTDTGTLCLNIDHPEGGIFCGNNFANATVNITYFRRSLFNDSKSYQNISFNSNNKTIYINAHQYDEVISLSLNLTAYESNNSYPQDVKIYVNGSLSNVIGDMTSSGGEVTKLSNGNSSEKIAMRGATETRYIKLPKNANINSAVFNISGYVSINGTCYQETANESTSCGGVNSGNYVFKDSEKSMYINYTRINNTGLIIWQVKHSNYTIYNVTIPSGCDKNTIVFRFETGRITGAVGSCYSSSWTVLTKASNWTGCMYVDKSYDATKNLYDGDWDSLAFQNGDGWVNNSDLGICPNQFWAHIYEEAIIWDIRPPLNPYIEVGISDGDREWNYSGIYNISTTIQSEDFSSEINSYLANCSEDDEGNCLVPIYFSSDNQYGELYIKDIAITYSYDINPVQIDTDLISNFLSESSNNTQIPITIENSANGTLYIDDLRYDYRGGNSSILVWAYENSTPENNQTDSFYVYYSNWNYSFPQFVYYLEFIPTTPTTKNVTPYGQTPNRPILNFSFLNYGGNMNFSIYLNETHECVNLTASTTNSKDDGFLLNNSWTTLFTNKKYLENQGIWLWADYSCSYSTWREWVPDLYLRGCCVNCACSEDI